VVLAASLLLTLVAAAIAARVGRHREAAQFDNAVQATTDRIRSRVESYETLLAGTAGLFAADENGRVTAAQFRAYVARLDLARRFPGVRGVGYTAVLWRRGGRPYDAAGARDTARTLGSDAPAAWPDPAAAPRDEVHAIVHLEPATRRIVPPSATTCTPSGCAGRPWTPRATAADPPPAAA
jgi:CHASE1-domain containing sensor protein